MSYTIEGVLEEVFPLQERSKRFQIQKFNLRHGVQEDQITQFTCINKVIDQMSEVTEGDMVRVEFILTGRYWTNQYKKEILLQSLEVIQIERI